MQNPVQEHFRNICTVFQFKIKPKSVLDIIVFTEYPCTPNLPHPPALLTSISWFSINVSDEIRDLAKLWMRSSQVVDEI